MKVVCLAIVLAAACGVAAELLAAGPTTRPSTRPTESSPFRVFVREVAGTVHANLRGKRIAAPKAGDEFPEGVRFFVMPKSRLVFEAGGARCVVDRAARVVVTRQAMRDGTWLDLGVTVDPDRATSRPAPSTQSARTAQPKVESSCLGIYRRGHWYCEITFVNTSSDLVRVPRGPTKISWHLKENRIVSSTQRVLPNGRTEGEVSIATVNSEITIWDGGTATVELQPGEGVVKRIPIDCPEAGGYRIAVEFNPAFRQVQPEPGEFNVSQEQVSPASGRNAPRQRPQG